MRQHSGRAAAILALILACSPVIRDAETVAKKIFYVNEVLGGLSRITFQMGVLALPHQKMLRSIKVLGTRVAPIIRKALTIPSSE
jgi:hypothetical protein